MGKAEWAKCPNGHQYSPELAECPYCPGPVSGGPARRKTPTDGGTLVETGNTTRGPDKTRVMSAESDTPGRGGEDKTIVESRTSSPSVSPPQDVKTHTVGAPAGAPGGGGRLTRVMTNEETPELRPIFAWIVVLEGAQQYRDFRISQDQVYIGGSAECDIVLDDEFISGEHASIRYREGQFAITDLDSKNGTFVNDAASESRIDRVDLSDGDEIRIGQVLMKFKCL